MTLAVECPRCGWSDIERDVLPLPYPDAMTTAFPAWTFDPYPLCPICTKEHAMTVLSARIFDLEHKAAQLDELQEKLSVLEQQVQESLLARQQLAHLHEYTERVLASGQLVSGALPATVPISGEYPDAPVPPIEATATPAPETPAADPVIDEPPADAPAPAAAEDSEPEATPTPAAPEPETSDEPQPAEVKAPLAAGPAPLDEQPMTNMGRVTAWVQKRTLTEVFTVAEAQAALGMKYASIAPVLSTLIRTGHVERVPGTGTSGVPSIYRLPGSTALPASPEPEPAAADPEPESAPQVTITGGRSLRGRILEFLQLNKRRAFTPDLVAAALDCKDLDEVRACLTEMSERGTVEFDRDAFGIGLTPQAKPFEPAAPAGPAPVLSDDLLPIPERLNSDERQVFDLLRRNPAGLSEKVIQHRVNWSTQRLARVIKGMLDHDFLHRAGDRLRAGAAHGKKVA